MCKFLLHRCVISELFMDGDDRLFDFASLVLYVKEGVPPNLSSGL